jgi:hypothetical protein
VSRGAPKSNILVKEERGTRLPSQKKKRRPKEEETTAVVAVVPVSSPKKRDSTEISIKAARNEAVVVAPSTRMSGWDRSEILTGPTEVIPAEVTGNTLGV